MGGRASVRARVRAGSVRTRGRVRVRVSVRVRVTMSVRVRVGVRVSGLARVAPQLRPSRPRLLDHRRDLRRRLDLPAAGFGLVTARRSPFCFDSIPRPILRECTETLTVVSDSQGQFVRRSKKKTGAIH